MSNNQKNVLIVTDVSETMQEDGQLSNDREYKVITVKNANEGGIIGTSRGHRRVIWSHQPMSGPSSDNPRPNDYFDKIKVGSKIYGSIETVETLPYYIPNENGKFVDPETQKPANKATQKTYVVFEDETAKSLARADNSVELPEEQQAEQISAGEQEMVNEDLGEEVAVS